jgi:hypothetical protein
LGARKFSLFDPTRTAGKLMQKFILLIFVVCLLGCHSSRRLSPKENLVYKKVQLISKQVDLILKPLIAQDIQENLTRFDELFVTYSLSVVDQDSVVKAAHATHYLGKIKKGAKLSLDSIPSLRLDLKEGQKIGIQIALWEIDDYSKSQKFLNKVSMYSDALQIPLTFIEWSSASNPLGWFLWGTRLSSVGLGFLASLDRDDLLGISERVWSWDDLSRQNGSRIKHIHWKGKDSAINSFHYEFAYEIKVKDIIK